LGKVDNLKGFKENVIMGHLIPAGTGLPVYRNLRIDTLGAKPVQLTPEEAAKLVEGVAIPVPEPTPDPVVEPEAAAETTEAAAETTEAPAETAEAPAKSEEAS
jgi:DNA-directed RNA polymerase subunit beta'